MISSVAAVADGAPGIQQIVSTLSGLREYYGRLPAIRAAAVSIVRGVGDHAQAEQVNLLAGFVRGAVRFLCDPLNAEFIQTPDVMLLDIDANGFTYGDCDDHCLLFAALCESIGIPCEIVGVAATGEGLPDHVICVAHLDSGALDFDLVAKSFEQPQHTGARVYPQN